MLLAKKGFSKKETAMQCGIMGAFLVVSGKDMFELFLQVKLGFPSLHSPGVVTNSNAH